MVSNIHLILHNLIGISAILVSLYVIAIIYLNDHKKTINITLILTFVGVIGFLISHLWGVNVSDPSLSRKILMGNLSVIFISMFNVHCVQAALKQEKEKRDIIIFTYVVGISLTIFYLFFPETFLLNSVPKMYFPNYYVPGQFYWMSRAIFQGIIPVYFIYELVRAYRRNVDPVERNRIIYFAIALFLGWGLGSIPPLLIFNIQVDPLYGLFFPIAFAIPFTYAVLRYELLDIRIVAKRAFLYTAAVIGIGGLITLFNFSDRWIQQSYPSFPFWISPLISALVVVVVALFVWKQLRQSDVLKYEFVTIATHKFRTPLTHIRWAAENLSGMSLPPNAAGQVKSVQSASDKLVELTNVLVNVSETENAVYTYKLENLDLSKLVEEVLTSLPDRPEEKQFTWHKNLPTGMMVAGDSTRLKFVIQTMIDNAIHFMPNGGDVAVGVRGEGKSIVFSVKDNGIGVAKNELPFMFTKFYRSAQAKLLDTEGMGIGLYLAKKIIGRHRGEIGVESDGVNQGSTFWFSLPASRL